MVVNGALVSLAVQGARKCISMPDSIPTPVRSWVPGLWERGGAEEPGRVPVTPSLQGHRGRCQQREPGKGAQRGTRADTAEPQNVGKCHGNSSGKQLTDTAASFTLLNPWFVSLFQGSCDLHEFLHLRARPPSSPEPSFPTLIVTHSHSLMPFAAGTSTKWDHPNHMDFDPVCISEMIFTNFPHVSIFRTTDWLMCYHSPASLMATQGWISIFSNILYGIAGTWDSLKVLHSAQILFGWRSGRIKGGPFPGLLGWHHNSSSTGLGQICRVLLFLEKIQDAKCLGGSTGHLQQGVRTWVKLQTLSPLRKVYFWKKIYPMSTHLLNTSKD